MPLLRIHALFYVVVNAALVVIWMMLGGTPDALHSPIIAARDSGFWPLWVIVGWGAVLALHAGLALLIVPPWRARHGEEVGQDRPGGRAGRRWLAVMFTDLSGSTELASQLGDEAWSELISDYRAIVRGAADDHSGREVGTQGDGMLLRFDSPRAAADCASALQQRFADERSNGGRLPPVRIGVHAGQAVERDDDVLGQMVNIAARVADAARDGEVLVTEPVADQARPAIDFDDRGLQELRGVSGPRHLLALRWDEVDAG